VTVTQSTYDTIAAEFERRTRSGFEGLAEEMAAFTAPLPAGARVADVGCGPGGDTGLLERRGYWVARLDLSEQMLRLGDGSRVVSAAGFAVRQVVRRSSHRDWLVVRAERV
jgi:SAM-dependent methyltransferase